MTPRVESVIMLAQQWTNSKSPTEGGTTLYTRAFSGAHLNVKYRSKSVFCAMPLQSDVLMSDVRRNDDER